MKRYAALLLLLLMVFEAGAQDAIQVGPVLVDPPTLCCLGFSVPISSGDDNYNADAQIEYRVQGTATWRSGLPLLRVRPETTSTETPPTQYGLPFPEEQFAGSLFYLEPDTLYEIRITLSDPDGGGVQMLNVSTRALPLSAPANSNIVAVSNDAELNTALANAQPGDVIRLAAGNYTGPISIDQDGTPENPIVLQGESRDSVIIDATGATYGVTLSGVNVYLETVSVRGSTWGALASDTEGIVIRGNRFTSVTRGIYAKSGSNRGFYICDNILEGGHQWPDVSSATWDDEGITVTGESHVVCFNTLSGFGDALGLGNDTSIINRAIDFYGNDVLWTGDDGIELDFTHRNVRAFEPDYQRSDGGEYATGLGRACLHIQKRHDQYCREPIQIQ